MCVCVFVSLNPDYHFMIPTFQHSKSQALSNSSFHSNIIFFKMFSLISNPLLFVVIIFF